MTTKSEITRRDTKKNINCRYFGDILHVYIILEEMLMLWCLKTWLSPSDLVLRIEVIGLEVCFQLGAASSYR